MSSTSVSRISSVNSDDEKDKKAFGLEGGNGIGSVPYLSSQGELVENDKAAERRLVRRIDLWVLPAISLLYGLSLDNRTDISFANANGMGVGLKLKGTDRFTMALAMYYVGYTLFGLPATLLIRSVRPRIFLAALILGWGATTLGVGYAANWQQLVALRTVLGALESGYFPVCVYLLTSWYERHELSPRLGFFYMSSVFAAGFGPILAYVFHAMHGIAGHAGWRWIFIMVGLLTCVAACMGYPLIPDFPNKATFLSEEQRHQALYRIEKDRGDSVPDPLTFKKAIKHLSSIEVWTLSIAYGAATVATNSFPFFIPIVLHSMGYMGWKSSLLVAPPYIATVFISIPMAHFTDKYRMRSPFIVAYILTGIVGFIIVNNPDCSPGVKYFATFLCVFGSYSQVPKIVSMLHNNIVSDSKRAVISGFSSSFAGVGGIIGSVIYRHQDRPVYHIGLIGTMIAHAVCLIFVVATALIFRYRNKKLDEAAKEANLSEADISLLSIGEQAQLKWRYTL